MYKALSALEPEKEIKAFLVTDAEQNLHIMGRYFQKEGRFLSVHFLAGPGRGGEADTQADLPRLTVYAASFYKDKPLANPPQMPSYVKKLYLGCEGAARDGIEVSGQASFYDNTGDNISAKNPNRCEMTAHYWVWKNRLHTEDEYVGICHYRRTLDRIEEFSKPKGADRRDRYTAYMSESLETLYFMTNREKLKIYHTGRILYT